MRTFGVLSLSLAVAIVVGIATVLAWAPPQFLIGTLTGDDAGYYLAIARNAALGHGLSFDRLHPTNGFNPLMPLLLVPLDRVFAPGLGLVACFRIGLLVTWVALASSLASLHALGRHVLSTAGMSADVATAANRALLAFVAGFVALKGYYAMDAFLGLALGLAYLERVARSGPLAPGWQAAWIDGALLGATVLARVDSLPLVASAFAVMLPDAIRDRSLLARAAWRALWAGLLVGSYFVWGWIEFGDWLPISARLKSAFPHWDLAASLHTVRHTSLNAADQLALGLALAAALGWCALRLAHRRRAGGAGAPRWPLVAMDVWALYLAARLGWLVLFSRLDVQGSYFILAHPFLALAATLSACALAGGRGMRFAAALLSLAGLGLALAKLATTLPAVRAIAAGQGDEWAIARRVHDVTREGDVIYGGAFGLIGFIADRPWINGDGVANDRAYQDAIRDGRLAEHLAGLGVDYVAVALPRSAGSPANPLLLSVRSLLHGASDTLRLDPGEIVLREPMRRGGGTELFLIRTRGLAGPRD